MTKADEENLDLHEAAKSAAVTMLTGDPGRIVPLQDGHLVFRHKRTPQAEKALQDFFDDISLPSKTFSHLTKSLQYQLMGMKKRMMGDAE